MSLDDLDEILAKMGANKGQEPQQQKQLPQQPIKSQQNMPMQMQPMQQMQAPMQQSMQPYGMQPYYPQQPPMYQQQYPQQPMYPVQQYQTYQPPMQPQPPQQFGRMTFQTPDEAENIDISNVQIEMDKQFQIYIGNLPRGCMEQELRETFSTCGDIKNVFLKPDSQFGFVNFARKEGAMNALMQRYFTIRGSQLTLAGFHKKLQIILRRIPPKVQDENLFQSCLQKYLHSKFPELFCYSQLQPAKFGMSAYLHFLSKEDSINAFEALKSDEFTRLAAREFQLVNNLDKMVIISNEEVEKRQQENQVPNQNLETEVLQFLCLRFVDKSAQRVNQNPQPMQPQQYAQQPQQYGQFQPQQQFQQSYGAPMGMMPTMDTRPKMTTQSENSVYLKMMPFRTNQANITQALQSFGQITHITLINDKEANGYNPCAIVYFQTPESAQAALNQGTVIVNGGSVFIQRHVRKGIM